MQQNEAAAQPEIGRLLVEILGLTTSGSSTGRTKLRLRLGGTDGGGGMWHEAEVAPSRDASLFTTQFALHSLEQTFHLVAFVPAFFQPTQSLVSLAQQATRQHSRLGELSESVRTLTYIVGNHSGPIIRLLPLRDGESTAAAKCEANIKFFVQLFDR